MKLIHKESGETEYHSWDAAQALLAAGSYDKHPEGEGGERGPDVPTVQAPFPGTDPKEGSSVANFEGGQLVNMGALGSTETGLMTDLGGARTLALEDQGDHAGMSEEIPPQADPIKAPQTSTTAADEAEAARLKGIADAAAVADKINSRRGSKATA